MPSSPVVANFLHWSLVPVWMLNLLKKKATVIYKCVCVCACVHAHTHANWFVRQIITHIQIYIYIEPSMIHKYTLRDCVLMNGFQLRITIICLLSFRIHILEQAPSTVIKNTESYLKYAIFIQAGMPALHGQVWHMHTYWLACAHQCYVCLKIFLSVAFTSVNFLKRMPDHWQCWFNTLPCFTLRGNTDTHQNITQETDLIINREARIY